MEVSPRRKQLEQLEQLEQSWTCPDVLLILIDVHVALDKDVTLFQGT